MAVVEPARAHARPVWLSVEAALGHAGGLPDTPAGHRRYLAYLGWLQEDDAAKKALAFDRMLKDWAVGKTDCDVRAEAKGAAWKAAVASAMKSRTTASNPWLARRLKMGSPFRLSRLASVCASDPTAFEPYASRMAKCKV